jgi:predicted dehydrogenase
VGVGKIARDQHVPSIRANERFSLAAAASRHSTIDGIANFPSIDAMIESCAGLDAIAICTPPQLHYKAARLALSKGKHVLLEKPPCTSTLELAHLSRLARDAGRSLYQTWHSQHAHAVAPAATLLRKSAPRRVRVTWKEDVRRWHPGQTWIWQPGGFGVFDPGINALSILTKIIPDDIFPRSAHLYVPSNCHAPIAADLELVTARGTEISAAFDFRQTGDQTWDIAIETDDAPLVLSAGGGNLTVGNEEVPRDPGALESEYVSIYRDFAGLIARGESEVDARPLQLVADIFLIAQRSQVEAFVE